MIMLRPSKERGNTKANWLDSRHTFSFGDYYDPEHMGFRSLRVINEDRVRPATGFDTHSHRDMEILTYVLDGALEHKDSLGNHFVIHPGELQRMTAGTGISHSEKNPSQLEEVHFFQIWVLPEVKGLRPSYQQRHFRIQEEPNTLHLVASKESRDGALTVHQDVDLYLAHLKPDKQVTRRIKANRHAWLQVAQGKIVLNGIPMEQGDGAAISQEEVLEVTARSEAEILLFDLT